jgi:WD40 repeat protein
VWDAATGLELLVLKGHAGIVRSVVFSPDGKHIVTGSNDRTAKVWDAEKGQEIPTLKGHTDYVSSIAFSPDGKRIVTGSGDGTAKVWVTATGQEILTLEGSTSREWAVGGIWGVAFSPDGRRIVTGSQDKTAKVWNAATGRVLHVLEHTNAVRSVAFSPDGRRIVTATGDWDRPERLGEASVWDTETGQELRSIRECGMPRRAGKSLPSRGTRARCTVWRSAPMVSASSLAART